MNIDHFIKADRLRESVTHGRSILVESESDKGRLVYCAAFRRLQQKAQVFSMESNAAVRSRLTHSLEVAQIGRYIASAITNGLKKANPRLEDEKLGALINFVEIACLMHDIGNPPFGHFGEAAIQQWFSKNGPGVIKEFLQNSSSKFLYENSIDFLQDFIEFDGNPQGLRTVLRLQRNNDEHGLNLTLTSLASYMKYLRMAGEKRVEGALFSKKPGYFTTERDAVHAVWKFFGFQDGPPKRFPLTYIMEAADDIAYCISDLEDSIEKKIISKVDCFSEIAYQWGCSTKEIKKDSNFDAINVILTKAENRELSFLDFRTHMNRVLVDVAAQNFIKNVKKIENGELESLIENGSSARIILDIFRKYCVDKVYCHDSVQKTELAGYSAIYGLLDVHFRDLLTCTKERFERALIFKNTDENGEPIITERKMLKLLPLGYIKTYTEDVKKIDLQDKNFALKEWNCRAHLIVDFISGMTDDYVMTTYRTLSGMKL